MRLLYIQHAGSPGGSVVSLRYLVEGVVAAGHQAAVAMVEPNPDVRRLYEASGAEVFDAAEIPLFRHTTAGWASLGNPRACLYQARAIAKRPAGMAAVRRIVDTFRPELIHLNSVTLALVATGLRGAAMPVVWHVRESPVSGYVGLRQRILRDSLLREADEIIFLSESDRQAWVQGRRGEVVHNVVPIRTPPDATTIARERERFGLRPEDRAVCYVGGLAEIKGIFPLIDAVRTLLPRFPRLRIVAPGTKVQPASTLQGRIARHVLPALGLARDYERASRAISWPCLADVFRRGPFLHDILPVIAACEFLVFPSTRPHFARPVVEAASVGRASIGSDLGGVRDLIDPGRTGAVVPAGDPSALAQAMERFLVDREATAAMGTAAQQVARDRFDATAQVRHILDIYERVTRQKAQSEPASVSVRSAATT